MDFLYWVIPLAFLGVFVFGTTGKAALYRPFLVVLLASVTVLAGWTYGAVGALAALGIIFGVAPIVVMLVTNIVMSLAWKHTRKAFPDEPETPPSRATLTGVYQAAWNIL